MKRNILLTLLSIFCLILTAQQETKLLRFPTIHGDKIVFSYAGDLYSVSRSGGQARQLTTDIGYEMFAKFSPDGSKIAFTAQYDGNTEVYVMPAEGGIPKRLTYTATLERDEVSDRMGPNNIVMTWTNDGKHIIYRSRKKTYNDFIGHLYKVSVDGGPSTEIPLSTGGFCSFSPDGKNLAFNRVFREFRTWKYYHGGMADDIRIFNLETKKIENITNNIAQDIFPMWIGDDIFYVSDRDRISNIFAYNTKTRETKKITSFDRYDVKFPSHSKDAIIFENGGSLWIYDVKKNTTEKLTIYINNDLTTARNAERDASKNISRIDLSPDGERLVVSARGDVFSLPSETGITRNLTRSSNAHDRNAIWSPCGKHIAYLSDKSGEFEIYLKTQDGSSEAIQLTKDADTYYFSLSWSPDGKYILFNDKKMRLRYVDVATKEIFEVIQSKIWEITDFSWSNDSKWISYTNPEENGLSTIKLYSLENKKTFEVTDYWYRSYSPTFSKDNKYLFFISDRDFNPTYSRTEWNHSYSKMSRVYFVNLSKDTPNPLSPKNNEVKISKIDTTKETNKKDNKKADKSEKTKEAEAVQKLVIHTDNMNSRILSLPIEASDYSNLLATNDKAYYIRNNSSNGKRTLFMYSFEDREEKEIAECTSFIISQDGKKMLFRRSRDYYVINVPTSSPKLEKKVSFNNMQVYPDFKQEWTQIYYESWRQMRDFFYDENMHGIDWNDVKVKYDVFLPYVKHKHDLNYIIGEMIGELNVGHAYVNGGDLPQLNRIKLGLLGAELSKDNSGYYKIEKILDGANWSKQLRSPLLEPGINIKTGEFITAINGIQTNSVNDINELLINLADKQVELSINSKAEHKNSRKIIVEPISDVSALYYYNWVQNNIKKVNEATNGEVGYIHIPDMGVEGLNEFVKHFYAQLHKKALIIDDRGNGGGNVSPMIIERLQREIQRANMARNVQIPSQTPRQMLNGPIVVLINQYSASDGDLFPYGIKHYGIGKVIGVRSWGGVVGIRGSLPFLDGSTLNRPEFASYDHRTGEWIIEGWGVEPDIEIDNDPYQEYLGVDTQLEKAIEEILKEMKNFKPIHPIPQGPDKSK